MVPVVFCISVVLICFSSSVKRVTFGVQIALHVVHVYNLSVAWFLVWNTTYFPVHWGKKEVQPLLCILTLFLL